MRDHGYAARLTPLIDPAKLSTLGKRGANVIANLELLPLKLNESKNSKIGERQLDLAHRFREAGMLSQAGLHSVETHSH